MGLNSSSQASLVTIVEVIVYRQHHVSASLYLDPGNCLLTRRPESATNVSIASSFHIYMTPPILVEDVIPTNTMQHWNTCSIVLCLHDLQIALNILEQR